MLTINSHWVRFFHLVYVAYWTINEIMPGYERESVKYLFMLIPIMIAFMIFWKNGAKIRRDTLELRQLVLYMAFAVGVTFVAAFINEYWVLDLRDMGRMLFPMVYAFLLINTDTTENKDFYVDSIFIICTIVILRTFWGQFTLANIFSINLADSYSPFEHHLAHEYAFLSLYYYIRRRRTMMLLSAFFSLLTFKRIHILFVVLVLLFGWFFKNARVTNAKLNVLKVVFCLTPILMNVMASPGFVTWFDNTFETSFYMFTMSRLGQFSEVLRYEGSLLGLQAVEQYLLRIHYGTIFHSDLLRISIETTFAGLFLYVNASFNLLKAHRNIYACLGMLLMFLTMFSSVNLQRIHTYLLLYFICLLDFEAAAKEKTWFERLFKKRAVSALPPRQER